MAELWAGDNLHSHNKSSTHVFTNKSVTMLFTPSTSNQQSRFPDDYYIIITQKFKLINKNKINPPLHSWSTTHEIDISFH